MSAVLAALARHGASRPGHEALTDGESALDYRTLHRAVVTLAAALRSTGARVVALDLPDGLPWLLADLAALAARIPCVPVPPFFSAAQRSHLLVNAGVDTLIAPEAGHGEALAAGLPMPVALSEIAAGPWRYQLQSIVPAAVPALPGGTAKITYTSGTTGDPKGVCLTADAMDAVAAALTGACALAPGDRHASLLPLATLLQNIGVYAHLLAGACCVVPAGTGTARASGSVDGPRLLHALAAHGATTAILVPEMLRALVEAVERDGNRPQRLRFVAVGGAPVSPRLLARAARQGLPVYEGYGLTECASVVALNTPGANRPGSAGRPLAHAALEFTADGEILVRGALYAGYIGEPVRASAWHATGDVGRLDEDGYLHLTGRRRNVFITSHGRNVSPEWVERELTEHAAIAHAWVYGEARPWNAAIIVGAPGATAGAIDEAVRLANAHLPDYAQVRRWARAAAPFSTANGQCTANGRLRRDALLEAYRPVLQAFYAEDIHALS